jgi:hypothetical protein
VENLKPQDDAYNDGEEKISAGLFGQAGPRYPQHAQVIVWRFGQCLSIQRRIPSVRDSPNLPLAPGSHTEKKLMKKAATPDIKRHNTADSRGCSAFGSAILHKHRTFTLGRQNRKKESHTN